MSHTVPREARTCLTCGAEFQFRKSPSREGRGKYCSRSCGAKATSVKHGHARDGATSPTYGTYMAMLGRCYSASNDKYEEYGAKGVTVCDRWRESFKNFLDDMGERPPMHTIDRRDGKQGYSPENCRWATIREQQRNLKNNRNITHAGKTQCISAWAEETGLSHCTISYRIKRGWPMQAVLGTPAKLGNRVAS